MHGTDAKVCCEILFIFPLNVNNSSSPHIIGRAQKGRHHNRSHNSAEIFYQDFKPEIFSNSIGTETRVIFLVWTDWQRILSAPQFCKFDFIILTCSAAKKCWDKCVGRSELNVHCHLAVKLSERASFNKFNKNFTI